MTRVLLTAFEPYERWSVNASWLLIEQLTRDLPTRPEVTTRRYPVDFAGLRERLAADVAEAFDVILLLGQAPGRASIELEAIGVNVALPHDLPPEQARPLVADGPVAYRTSLPLESWARQLREQGIPTRVSFHAGTFLCNAAMYLAHHAIQQLSLATKAALLHIPVDTRQVALDADPEASLPVEISTLAVRWLLEQIADGGRP